jgi:hypothetical protein
MTAWQCFFHTVFSAWLFYTTYTRLVTTNKHTNILALTALRILGIGSFVSLMTPLYLWAKFDGLFHPHSGAESSILIWVYIFLVGAGAFVQTVFGLFWKTGLAQRIYNQNNMDDVATVEFKPRVVRPTKEAA